MYAHYCYHVATTLDRFKYINNYKSKNRTITARKINSNYILRKVKISYKQLRKSYHKYELESKHKVLHYFKLTQQVNFCPILNFSANKTRNRRLFCFAHVVISKEKKSTLALYETCSRTHPTT